MRRRRYANSRFARNKLTAPEGNKCRCQNVRTLKLRERDTVTDKDSGITADHVVPHRVSQEIIIAIEDVQKWYGDFQVLKNINLTVNKGERIVVCGPSGSGKSTLIRSINRLEQYQKGRIIVDGIDLGAGGNGFAQIVREGKGGVLRGQNIFRIDVSHVGFVAFLSLKAGQGEQITCGNGGAVR